MDQNYNYVSTVEDPTEFIKDSLKRSNSRLRTILNQHKQKITPRKLFDNNKLVENQTLLNKASFSYIQLLDQRKSTDDLLQKQEKSFQSERMLNLYPDFTQNMILPNNSQTSLKLYEAESNLNSDQTKTTALREDLQQLKEKHVQLNLNKQIQRQRDALNRSDLTEQERYDLKCFAPESIFKEAQSSSKLKLKSKFQPIDTILEEQKLTKQQKVKQELRQIDNIAHIHDIIQQQENMVDAEAIDGRGDNIGRDSKYLINEYFESTKSQKGQKVSLYNKISRVINNDPKHQSTRIPSSQNLNTTSAKTLRQKFSTSAFTNNKPNLNSHTTSSQLNLLKQSDVSKTERNNLGQSRMSLSSYEDQKQFLKKDMNNRIQLRSMASTYQKNVQQATTSINFKVPAVITTAVTRSKVNERLHLSIVHRKPAQIDQPRGQTERNGVRGVLEAARIHAQDVSLSSRFRTKNSRLHDEYNI